MTPPSGRISRRAFVTAAAALAAGGCRPRRYRPGDFARPAESPVALIAAPHYGVDLADLITRGLRTLDVDLSGARVLLKPNLVEFEPESVINTHPAVIGGAAVACRRLGAREVVVAEGPGHRRDLEYLLASTRTLPVLRDERLPFVDLNHDDVAAVPLRTWYTDLGTLALPQAVLDADVIVSLPKLKTHHWAVATLSLKNLFGTMPGICYGWPKNELHWRGIDNSIVDIAVTRTPDLAIVDGIVGMEGDGPLNGTPRHMGVIVMGADLVAVDATCCRLMQLDPERVGYLVMAHRKKLGHLAEANIQQLGETIEGRRQPFDTVPHFKPLWLGRPA